jgi:hypothetical protein
MAPGIGGINIPASPRQNKIENKIENTIENKIENKVENKFELEPQVQHQRLLIFDAAAEAKPSALARFGAIPLVLCLAALLGLGTLTGLISLDGARRGLADPAAMLASLIAFPSTQAPARLIVANQRGRADEPLPLGISVEHASDGQTVTIRGLPEGGELSLGSFSASAGWTVVVGALDSDVRWGAKGIHRQHRHDHQPPVSHRPATGRADASTRMDRQEQGAAPKPRRAGGVRGRSIGVNTGGTVAQGPPQTSAAEAERRRPRRRILRR